MSSRKNAFSTKKIISLGMLLLFLGGSVYIFLQSEFIYRVGSNNGIRTSDYITISHRVGDNPQARNEEFARLIQERAVQYYGEYVGLVAPECQRLRELRALIVRDKQNKYLTVEEKHHKAKAQLIHEQLMAPIKCIPVINEFDKKIATTISRCVDGYFLRISSNNIPAKFRGKTGAYVKYLRNLFGQYSDNIEFVQELNFAPFKGLSHFKLFWNKKCEKCTAQPCKECIISTDKDMSAFMPNNPYKLRHFEAISIVCAKHGELQIINCPGTDDWIAVFVTKAYLDPAVYQKVLLSVQSEYHNLLSRIHEAKICEKVQAGTDQHAAGWAMMMLFAIFFIYF